MFTKQEGTGHRRGCSKIIHGCRSQLVWKAASKHVGCSKSLTSKALVCRCQHHGHAKRLMMCSLQKELMPVSMAMAKPEHLKNLVKNCRQAVRISCHLTV